MKINNICIVATLAIFTIINAKSVTETSDLNKRQVTAIRLQSPLTIDGILDEDLYSTKLYSDFVQYVPDNGASTTEKTDMWIGYDESAIYVGARMWDSEPDLIVSGIGRRDENDDTDLFEIIIDSYYDKRTGFSFQINPVGAVNDEAYFNDGFTQRSWDAIWEGKTTIDDKGWTAELAIPFSAMHAEDGVPPKPGDRWRVNFFRVDKTEKKNRYSAWSPPLRGDFHALDKFGQMAFVKLSSSEQEKKTGAKMADDKPAEVNRSQEKGEPGK